MTIADEHPNRVIRYEHVWADEPAWLPPDKDGQQVDGQTLRYREVHKVLSPFMQIDPVWGKAALLDEWRKLCLERAKADAGKSWIGPTEGRMKAAARAIAGVA